MHTEVVEIESNVEHLLKVAHAEINKKCKIYTVIFIGGGVKSKTCQHGGAISTTKVCQKCICMDELFC